MLKRHKDYLRAVVAELRHVLAGYANGSGAWQRGDLDREMERLGIAPDGAITPLDALPSPTDAERRARYVADAQLASLQNSERIAARTELVERAAYSWINRLLALWVMEARGLIDETLRSNPEYGGVSEALYILRSQAPDRAAGPDGGWWAVVEDACAAQSATLPGLFDPRDPVVALRPSTPALLRCVALVGNVLPGYTVEEVEAAFADPDAIGWAYQFYQEEAKARTYAKLFSGGKAETRAEIASATQLFTERYMVQWLLQNSLGRSYHEAYPDSRLPATWAYYVQRSHEDRRQTPSIKLLSELTVMDPCMGSGHFLREAFDMLVAMYREQEPQLATAQIADRILSYHIYGVDIDPRAAQLAALSLCLRAWELIQDEHRAQERLGLVAYKPPAMNLATTPSGLSAGALERHLRRHPGDSVFKPLLEGIFAALENADLLGSLLQPGAQLDAAIVKLQQPHTIDMDFDADQAELRRTITDLAGRDSAGLKTRLLDRVAASFAAEVGSADVVADLFGREAQIGALLLQLLDRSYAIVATNPPFMGSKNMNGQVKQHVESCYPAGRRDLYAAFILRSLELCSPGGRIAMVTMNKWLLGHSYVEIRSGGGRFAGILRESQIEVLCDLGSRAFSPDNHLHDGVQVALFSILKTAPSTDHDIMALRIVAPRSPDEKHKLMLARPAEITSYPRQLAFLEIIDAPIMYYLGYELLTALTSGRKLGDTADLRTGLQTSDNRRFTRCFWEVTNENRWLPYAKGGGYCKWAGLEWLCFDWEHNGRRLKSFPASVLRAQEFYFRDGLTYTPVTGGALGIRRLHGSAFDVKGASLFSKSEEACLTELAACLNTHVCSYFTRAISRSMELHVGYLAQVPIPRSLKMLSEAGRLAESLKSRLVSALPTERTYSGSLTLGEEYATAALLHAVEGTVERDVCAAYGLSDSAVQTIMDETGCPAGWHPTLDGYDSLPDSMIALYPSARAQAVVQAPGVRGRDTLSIDVLAQLKTRLRALVESGPGTKVGSYEEVANEEGEPEDDEDARSASHTPVPAETFVEDLSIQLRVHPVSIYNLLIRLRAEGIRCKPEEQRLLEDRLSVMLLRLLGHRWPKQIEAGEPVPEWADSDGIIPITAGTGGPTVAERLRERLRAEEGDLGAQRTEALLQELVGLSLDEWVRRQFFPRHVRQFKYRPIAWHLSSVPRGGAGRRRGARRQLAFECLLYYHACGGDALARLRSLYLQPLILVEQRRAEDARRVGDETAAALAAERIAELESFAAKLRRVDEEGFACPELDELMAVEPLDRWSGDGRQVPPDREELLRSERAWHVDINDGVRVNIAPLQLAGVLASDVLKTADARKAIADRAHWRADERRWVREGKLPRCGWMGEDVPESPRWRELAPQREAERRKLEEKRKAAPERLL